MLVTRIHDRIDRMQNYLRVIAEIFYQNYDQDKFKYVLDRIMNQVNRVQFMPNNNLTFEEEQAFLFVSNPLKSKEKIKQFINRSNQSSKLAYIISVILLVCILILGFYYIIQKWQ